MVEYGTNNVGGSGGSGIAMEDTNLSTKVVRLPCRRDRRRRLK